jgi:hypothetical protein
VLVNSTSAPYTHIFFTSVGKYIFSDTFWSWRVYDHRLLQGCHMVCFQTKNPNLGKFWRFLQWKTLVYFMTIRCILPLSEKFNGHLVYFVVNWYIFPRFGITYVPRKIWQPWFAFEYKFPGRAKIL